MNGSYTLHPVGDSQFHWALQARNGQAVLSSQIYAGKAGAESGIESCRTNSPDDARYERLTAQDSRPYFVLRAANGEIIGTSHMYNTVATRDQGIASCKEAGPIASLKYAPANR